MIEGDDRELFERSLRQAVAHRTGAALDAELAELGWADALEHDPRTAVSLLFTLQGEAGATSSALDRLVSRWFVPGVVLPGSLVPGAVPGGEPGGVVLPSVGTVKPPGHLDGARLVVDGLGSSALAVHERALLVARTDDGAEVATLVPVAPLAVRPIEGLDPDLGLVEVTGEVAVDDASLLVVPGWNDAVARAQLAIGHELVGASRTMLAMARDHAMDRIQFGQPIARFQAVRHRLADTLVAIETAEAALEAGWLDGSPTAAAMAKALAGRGARTAARHCQQVLAGIGFTTEHDLHRYVRRVLVLDELFGSSRPLTRALGDDLLSSRRLPPLLPL